MEAAFISSGQRTNALWAAFRKLRFTASNFGQVFGAAKRNRYFHIQNRITCLEVRKESAQSVGHYT